MNVYVTTIVAVTTVIQIWYILIDLLGGGWEGGGLELLILKFQRVIIKSYFLVVQKMIDNKT